LAGGSLSVLSCQPAHARGQGQRELPGDAAGAVPATTAGRGRDPRSGLREEGRAIIGLDFESFSKAPLPVVGLDNYIRDPSTRPLIASIASVDATTRYDFVFGSDGMDPVETRAEFVKHIAQVAKYHRIVAHNAGFERAALQLMGAGVLSQLLIDSAVIARGVGAGSRLESAAPQLLDANKMPEGARLIKKFSMPQEDGRILVEDPESWSDEDYDDWETFGLYCDLDAELSLGIAQAYSDFPNQEWEYEHLTPLMNLRGWPVDLDLVQGMH